jgi:flagellar FliJ protein
MDSALLAVEKQAEAERDLAWRALQQAQAQRERMRSQGGQLHAYRQETLARGPAHQGRSADMAMVICHRDFVERLDQALQQHEGALHAAEARCRQLQQALVAREQRLAVVRKLLQRREHAQHAAAARQDQRRTDEAAQQAHWRLATAARSGSDPPL